MQCRERNSNNRGKKFYCINPKTIRLFPVAIAIRCSPFTPNDIGFETICPPV
jgi:hypothetical protein